MIIDNESEPGAWKREMERMPWGYGQTQTMKLEKAMSDVRACGLLKQALTIEQEILTLKAELDYLRQQQKAE